MKRKLVFQFDKSENLSIRIECAHGSLYAMNWNEGGSIVAARYMIEELRRDKDAMRAFDIEFIEPE